MQLIVSLRAVKKIDFIKFNLKKIELAKEIFVRAVEQGSEVLIPKELSQDNLPGSMRFYDPILILLQDFMSIDQKEFFYTSQNIKSEQQFDLNKKLVNQFANQNDLVVK